MRFALAFFLLVIAVPSCSPVSQNTTALFSFACAVFDAIVDITKEDAEKIDAAVEGDMTLGEKVCQVFAPTDRVSSSEPQRVSATLPNGSIVSATIRPSASLPTE